MLRFMLRLMSSARIQKIVVSFAALSVFICVPVLRAADAGSVKGVVKNASGKPLSGAYVKLVNADKRLTFMVISQDQGKFTAENLPAGNYTVQGIGSGFQSDFKPVEVKAGKSAAAELSLTAEQPPTIANGWPGRPGNVAGAEIWAHEKQTPLVDGDGKQIIQTKCMQCHETERIVLLRMTPEKWAFTVNRMRGYITAGHFKTVSDDEARTLVDYLSKNYTGKPGTANVRADANSRLSRTLLTGDAAKYIAVDYRMPEDPNRGPHDLTVDRTGAAWMPDRLGCCLSKFDPKTFELTTLTLPQASVTSRLGGAIARNEDKTVLWVLDAANRRYVSYDTKDSKFSAYPIPATITGPMNSNTLIVDKKGMVWGAGNQFVLGLEPSSGKFVTYDIPYWVKNKQSADGYGMAVAGDGKVWFAEREPSLIGRLDPATGKIDEFEPPIANSIPRRMGADSAGNVWVGLHNTGQIVKIDYETAKMTMFEPPTKNSAPYSIVGDQKTGIIWFSEQASDKITRFDPKTGVYTEYTVPTAESDMRRIEMDPTNSNRIWWGGDTAERIGYIEILK